MGCLAEIKANFGIKQALKWKARPVVASYEICHGSFLPTCKPQQGILNEKKKITRGTSVTPWVTGDFQKTGFLLMTSWSFFIV